MELIESYDRVIIMGDAVDAYGKKIQDIRTEGISMAEEDVRYQHADTVALMAAELFKQGATVNYENLKPDYMRIPEAERKLKEQKAAGGETGQVK